MEPNEQQQLALIAEMINTARREFNDKSFIYLMWGWAVCLASLAQFVLMQMQKEYNALPWLVVIPLAIILQVVYLMKVKQTEKVKSHMDKIMGNVWLSVGVSLAVVLFAQQKMQLNTYPVLMLLYGIGTFISGGIIRLTPMKAGAICCWVLGAVAFFVKFEYQLLLLSLSVVLSYIIPGYLLKNRSRQNV